MEFRTFITAKAENLEKGYKMKKKMNKRKNVKKAVALVLAAGMAAGNNGMPSPWNVGSAAVEAAEQTLDGGFVVEGTKLVRYEGTATEVSVPSQVTEIAAEAFKDNSTITKVTLPQTITNIGSEAFMGCTSLMSINLPESLKKISYKVFDGCAKLTAIKIPKSLEQGEAYFGDDSMGTFRGSSITDFQFAEGVTEIPVSLFAGCTFSSFTIPETVTKIEEGAFYGCTNLESINIPDSVTLIENEAFRNCGNLSQVKLSANLTELRYRAFGNCEKLTDIEIPRTLDKADTYFMDSNAGPFQGSGLTNVTFAKGITKIADCLFAGCTNLTAVEMPASVTTIGAEAFRGSGLVNIVIGQHVTEIQDNAFFDCASAVSLDLGNYVEKLGYAAFGNCIQITSVHIPRTMDTAAVYFMNETQGPFWNTGIATVTFDEGIKEISSNLFAGMPKLTSMTIPSTVEVIEEGAFNGCSALESVEIPWSVFVVGGAAFKNCTALTEIELKDAVDTIGEGVFEGCTGLAAVKLSNRVRVIAQKAFKGCTALADIELPASVTEIGNEAFSGCTALAEVTASGSVKRIGSYAFKNCGFMEHAVPEGVETMEQGAFAECGSLQNIVLPNSLAEMGKGVFQGCSALEEVTFGTGLATIPQETFSDCGALGKVVFPYGTKKIDANVFKNCTSFTEVTIPRTVTEIADRLSSYMGELTIYGVAGSVAQTYATENGAKEFKELTAHVESVELSDETLVLDRNDSKRLSARITPIDFVDDITWSSSDDNIAAVDAGGTVSAKGVGNAIITVTVGSISKTCNVTVINAAATSTQRQRTVLERGKAAGAVVEGTDVRLTFSEGSVAADKAVVVRTEKLGSADDAQKYKAVDALLKTENVYNTDKYALYHMEVNDQATGEEVELQGQVSVSINVPANMDKEKVVVVRMKEPFTQYRTASRAEVIVPTLSADGSMAAFNTSELGDFVVVETTGEVARPGDVNLDGVVDMQDAYAALKAALGVESLEGDAWTAANMNHDDKVDLDDVKAILRVVLKIG